MVSIQASTALRQLARTQGHQPHGGPRQVIVVLGRPIRQSTLCRTINRLETIDSGTIAIDGSVLPAEGKKLAQLRSDVGMVFQSFNLFAHKTIVDNVMLAPVEGTQSRQRTRPAKRPWSLWTALRGNQADKFRPALRRPQQRVAIARSLAMNPKVMLFDERPAHWTPR